MRYRGWHPQLFHAISMICHAISGLSVALDAMSQEYLHGQTLDISCWSERYSSPSTESLSPLGPSGAVTLPPRCLAGTWLNSRGSLGLNGFSCAACVQVVTPRYADLDSQIKQELFFAGGLQLHLTVDTRTRKSVTSGGALQSGSNQDAFVAELLPDAPETERRYRALSTGHCLTETAGQLSSSACGRDAEPDQLLEAIVEAKRMRNMRPASLGRSCGTSSRRLAPQTLTFLLRRKQKSQAPAAIRSTTADLLPRLCEAFNCRRLNCWLGVHANGSGASLPKRALFYDIPTPSQSQGRCLPLRPGQLRLSCYDFPRRAGLGLDAGKR